MLNENLFALSAVARDAALHTTSDLPGPRSSGSTRGRPPQSAVSPGVHNYYHLPPHYAIYVRMYYAHPRARVMSFSPSPLSPSFTHYLPCSAGRTALKWSIVCNIADIMSLLHTCAAAASAFLNDAPPRAAAAQIKTLPNGLLVRVAAAV